jgi:hypothetical protein
MNGDRLLHVIKVLVREVLNTTPPCHDFMALYRYRVVRMVANRAELQAVRKGAGLPDTLPVSIHPGMAGLAANLTPGALVLVAFIEGDPTQPIITHFATQDEPGFLPVSLALDATDEVRIGKSAAQVIVGDDLGGPQAVARAPEVQSSLDAIAATVSAIVALLTAPPSGLPVVTVPGVPPLMPLTGLSAGASTKLKAV